MAYAPLSTSGWSLGVLFPQDELMEDISRLNQTVLFISLIGFVFILAVIVWIAGSITKPLRLLSRATEQIGTGNLDIELPSIKSRDEVGRLAESFNYMKASHIYHPLLTKSKFIRSPVMDAPIYNITLLYIISIVF